MLFRSLFQSEDAPLVATQITQILLSGVLLYGLGRWLQGRLAMEQEFSRLLLMGMGAGVLIWWLHADLYHSAPKFHPLWQNSLPSLLVLVGMMMVAYQWTHNTGVGIALIGMCLPLVFAIVVGLTTVEEEKEFVTHPKIGRAHV